MRQSEAADIVSAIRVQCSVLGIRATVRRTRTFPDPRGPAEYDFRVEVWRPIAGTNVMEDFTDPSYDWRGALRIEERPRWQHDCDQCVFLGQFDVGGQVSDLYHCMQGGRWPTVIARWSDHWPDYSSGLTFAEARGDRAPFPALAEAKRRAFVKGLVIKEPWEK